MRTTLATMASYFRIIYYYRVNASISQLSYAFLYPPMKRGVFVSIF